MSLPLTCLGTPPQEAEAQLAAPERCQGYGALQSSFLTDWESGLDSWSVATHDVARPGTFDTPDWAVIGGLPDGEPGMAAFAANLDAGDCAADDESGALNLDSPAISIPIAAHVPRIAFNHWFETEFGWDGGNLKISVNDGPFTLIPDSAIEQGSYTDELFPSFIDELEYNTNPLAGQPAFTGTPNGDPTGSWVETRVNLLGIAAAGDSVHLRFDFGIDACDGSNGWYVDEFELYHCEAELPPSDCGNGVIDAGEQCDDGNDFIGDGCSNTCQVEEGWNCTLPTPPAEIADPGFEDGRPNAFWDEASTNGLGSPICDVATCNLGGGTGPLDGAYWVWLGGVSNNYQEGSVAQSVVLPPTVSELSFHLELPACDSPLDYAEVLVDNNRVFLIDGSSPLCGVAGYSLHTADISAYADGAEHDIEFHSESFSDAGSVSNFFIDNVDVPGTPSLCIVDGTALTLLKEVINDDGGMAAPSAWMLAASGPSGFSGPGPSVSSAPGFQPGSYDLSESGGPAGYSADSWVCTGGTQDDGDTITLAVGESAVCTLTNDDLPTEIDIFSDGFESN